MPESEDKERQIIGGALDKVIACKEDGEKRTEEQARLLRDFTTLILRIFNMSRDYKEGNSRHPVTHEALSLEQKSLWVLSAKIEDMGAKTKIVEYMKQLYPGLKEIELEVR
jgi:hypothetical protein